MSRPLMEARKEIASLREQLEAELGEKRTLQATLTENQEAIRGLRDRLARKGQVAEGLEAQIRQLGRDNDDKQAELLARDGTISSLRTEIEGLEQKILDLDENEREIRRQKAEEKRKEFEEIQRLEEARTHRRQVLTLQIKAAGLVAVIAAIVFGVLLLAGIDPPLFVIIGTTVLATFAAFFAPQIRDLLIQVSPHVRQYWRPISIGVCLALGITIASLGVNGEGWLWFLTWIFTFIVYAAIFHGLVEAAHYLFTEKGNGVLRDKVALGYIVAILGGILLAAIWDLLATQFQGGGEGEPPLVRFVATQVESGATRFLLQILTSALGVVALVCIAALVGWLGVKIARYAIKGSATLRGLFDKERREQKKIAKWLRGAKAVTAFVAVFVGYVVGSGYAYSNGLSAMSSYLMAFGIGFGCAAVFFLIEGKVLEACFLRKYGNGTLLLMVIGALIFAALTAFLSFGKVYYEASRGPRFAEATQNLLRAENEYLAATESTARDFAKQEPDPQNSIYMVGVRQMKEAIELASSAKGRDDLVLSAKKFQEGGVKVTDCLPRGKKDLLASVVVYPEPTPSDLSSQFWLGTEIPGVKVHEGSARQAFVAVFILDFLIAILAIFGWIFSKPKSQEWVEDEGHIVTVLGRDHCIIDLGAAKGVETSDALSVLNGGGEAIGSIEAKEPLGDGAFQCERVGRTPLEVGSRVRLAT